jgi:hypothetical protein
LLLPFRNLHVRTGAADHCDHQRRACKPLALEFDLVNRSIRSVGDKCRSDRLAGS